MIPGARIGDDGVTTFRVWAPNSASVQVFSGGGAVLCDLTAQDDGWYVGHGDAPAGTRYFVQLDDGPLRPDPASLHQPDGVHGPSVVVDLNHDWTDQDWGGMPLREHVISEVHVGTFTNEGTFEAAIDRLDHFVDLGVTTIELMPLAQCPGERNWGYDGVDLYAVQDSYGGPKGLQRFVDACHRRGLAVWLDVVYNHLGPEGNYLPEFGPYFTDRHHTPWGSAVNLDGPDAEHVRRFFIDNAITWARDFHIDGFRLDAVHALADDSDSTFLEQFATEIHELATRLGRPLHVVAENGRNDRMVLIEPARGGLGFDSAWNDEFHHAIHVAFTGERARYYAPFEEPVADLATAIDQGYVKDGGPVPYRPGPNAGTTADVPRTSLIVFAQNHDQIGNRGEGDRLTTLAPRSAIRLAAGLVLLAPWLPMLFMGEEWGETRPFLYFVDHGDPDLSQAVREGRNREFEGLITGDVPDPAARSTRDASVLDWSKLEHPAHRPLLLLHRDLIEIRRANPSITDPAPYNHTVRRTDRVITLTNAGHGPATLVVFNVGPDAVSVAHDHPGWRRLIDGDDRRYGGDGAVAPTILDDLPLQLAPWGFTSYREETR